MISRASASDVMTLTSDVGPAPMQVGACLVLDAGPGFDVAAAQECIGERIRAVPRLRQRLVAAPPGCGRPIWIDDAGFEIGQHVRSVRCPAPGDERALLDLASDVVTDPLPRSRPLWSAVFVTGLIGATGTPGGRVGLVVTFHHVLADGIGGLAVLAHLVDGMPAPPRARLPVPPPSRRSLAADAWRGRRRALSSLARTRASIGQAVAELGVRRPVAATRCSLNQPTGRGRRLAVVRASLADIATLAHSRGGTVNDVVLAAVTGALRALLDSRGESVGTLVVSVPVSARASDSTGELGNRSGVMPVALPADGDLLQRLERTAQITQARKASVPGASAALLGAAFRLLAAVHLLRLMMNHQHLIHTFVTDLRGPDQPLTFNGAAVTDVIPITLTTGNVTVAFGALSYAGTLTITVVADSGRVPDLPVLAAALQAELAEAGARPRQPFGTKS